MDEMIPSDLTVALARSRAVVALTGAGVSAESGIPTFRDAGDSFWGRYDPMDLATPEGFARDPALVSRWYDERRLDCSRCSPNPGHYALARLEGLVRDGGGEFTLITQNVDGLHRKAGSDNVIEVHGTIWKWRCAGCGKRVTKGPEPFEEYPARCGCGRMMRPDVVWFGEQLPPEALEACERALRGCDFFISVGTSAVVYPVAGFISAARAAGARTVEINPEPTPVSSLVDWSLRGRSGEILPRLVETLP